MGIEVRMMNVDQIDGFGTIERIAGSLSIKENPELVDVMGLSGVSVGGDIFEIRNNYMLSSCEQAWPLFELANWHGVSPRIWDNICPDGPDDCPDGF